MTSFRIQSAAEAKAAPEVKDAVETSAASASKSNPASGFKALATKHKPAAEIFAEAKAAAEAMAKAEAKAAAEVKPSETEKLSSFRATAEHDRRVRRPVEELVQIIASSRVEDPLLCFRAMRLLSDSLCGSPPSQLVAASCGVINVLVGIVESGPPTMRVQACVTLGAVVCDCPANQEEACRKLVVKSVCQLMNELGRRCESRAELHQSLESLVKNHPENRRLCEQFLDDENFSICDGVESREDATVDFEVEVCPVMGLKACCNPHCKLHHYSPAFYRTGKFDVPPRSLRGAACGQGAMCEIVLCGFKHPAPAR